MPGVFYEYLAFGSFWAFVIGLDLAALWSLRRSRTEATARVLWVVWIVAVPVIGVISYFIVQPTREEDEMEPVDSRWSDSERQRRSENIRR
ncbi:MAG TPA: PLD nuclease N-terminal domain-containing protein [Gemmataceae bacterium]|nr:PLD nuclease N-terminal domain-containing protein [Gemmataceae bacterium]